MGWVAGSKPDGSHDRSIVEDCTAAEPYLDFLEIADVLVKDPADVQHLDSQRLASEVGAQMAWRGYMTEQNGQGSKQRQAFVPVSLPLVREESSW